MRHMLITGIVFMFLGSGLALAGDQSSGSASCESALDINALPKDTQLLKTDFSDLEDYYTCKAAVKDSIELCDVFPEGSSQRTNCRHIYTDYYATVGKLYKYGKVSDELLNSCLREYPNKEACTQMGEVLLSGNADNCEHIEGATPDNTAMCKEWVSANPQGSKAYLMMALRKRDPALCDQISTDFSSVKAVCKGLLVKASDGCQLNDGVVKFKKLYCQTLK